MSNGGRLSVLFFLFFPRICYPQADSSAFSEKHTSLNKKRLLLVASTESTLYATSIIGLNFLWYKDYPRSSFHLFNDNVEWLQMDKVGHAMSSYYVGRIGIDLLKWSGVQRKKAIWYGGILGSVYQSTIEILDGFSSNWGFSIGDFYANTLGTTLVIGQELGWNEQRISLKYSFHRSPYAQYRPQLLGKNLAEQLIKDYNGQTYWLSLNIKSFLKKESVFPTWLNLAIGYGAEGMTGARNNLALNHSYLQFDRHRKYYLSLDIDFSKIKKKKKWLCFITGTFGFIKIPFPALVYTNNALKISALGF